MEFFRRAPGRPARLAVFPGAFNPVTVAHMALAQAALESADEVLFVLPRGLPHKQYSGASFAERVEMLSDCLADSASFSLASSEGGLFAEIAEECRRAYGERIRLSFLCGRDAAERVVNWDYGRPDAFAGMVRAFDLLVAARGGAYEPAPNLAEHVRPVEVAPGLEAVSASEIRRRIAQGEPWEHMAPAAIREKVKAVYRAR
jgi:nicotinate-nucleotide adenylyltransferase